MTVRGVEIDASRNFVSWLIEQRLSLAITTYQSNRLLLVGVNPQGRLSVVLRSFDRIMGLWASPDRLCFSTRHQIWQLPNALPDQQTRRGSDRLYIPRLCHYTGEIDAHDLAVDAAGRLVFINTLHSCVATTSERYSFEALWRPPFISRLAPEDRCHLNGLALRDGQPRYVSYCGASDISDGWRDFRDHGGAVMDISSNQPVVEGLSMPHSPRWYQERLWLIDSGRGDLGWVDLDRRAFQPLAFLPGYGRGLAFSGQHALVGLSLPRDKTFTGLPLDQRLAERNAAPRCGLMVIDLTSGDVLHWLRISGLISEIYDVQVLPGVRHPSAVGLESNELRHTLVLEPAAPQSQPSWQEQAYRRAMARKAGGEPEAALHELQALLEKDPAYGPAHYEAARLHQKLNQLAPAIALYQKALAWRPGLTTAWFNLGVAYQAQRDTTQAIEAYRKAIALRPDHGDALNNLGVLLEAEHRPDPAIACFRKACRLSPEDSRPFFNHGRLLASQKDYEQALPLLTRAHHLDPDSLQIQLELEFVRLWLADWRDYDQRMHTLRQRLDKHYADPDGEALTSLLTLYYLPLPVTLHRTAAERLAASLADSVAEQRQRCAFQYREASPNEPLRLGYLSPDFRTHPVGMLVERLFALHDRSRFQVYGYALHPSEDQITATIRSGCDHYTNLADATTEEAARRIHADGIDILVDLAGYTTHSRGDVLALQPAPLQLHYLGYPGTLGAASVQAMLADPWLIPPETTAHYSEQVVHLRHAFLSSPLPVSPEPLSRSALGLPTDAVVFACFCRGIKIEPTVFSCWMRILGQVPDSVLWLSAGPGSFERNLRQAAASQGIAPERLIFAAQRPMAQYLAQYHHVDVLLDTLLYSAGSTAICALAAGVPLLTVPGNTYASRMGASVMAAASAEEWICDSLDTYEQRAISLGSQAREGPGRLRPAGWRNAEQSELFNLTARVRDLETALERLWAEYGTPTSLPSSPTPSTAESSRASTPNG